MSYNSWSLGRGGESYTQPLEAPRRTVEQSLVTKGPVTMKCGCGEAHPCLVEKLRLIATLCYTL